MATTRIVVRYADGTEEGYDNSSVYIIHTDELVSVIYEVLGRIQMALSLESIMTPAWVAYKIQQMLFDDSRKLSLPILYHIPGEHDELSWGHKHRIELPQWDAYLTVCIHSTSATQGFDVLYHIK